jgi:hypothetical protein
VKPAWTAGVTRARLLLSRSIGPARARAVAGAPSLADALAALAGSAYGERVHAGQDVAAAQRGVADTLLWHLRILAGWLPGTGGALIRTLAGWFEIANVDARIAALVGDGREPKPFALGTLATAWRTADRARTIEELADAVVGSAWAVPPVSSPAELALGLRVAWAHRVQAAAPDARDWVEGAGALLVARERLVARNTTQADLLGSYPGVGEPAIAAGTLADLRDALSPRARWALAAVAEPAELWRAELGWWDRVSDDAQALVRGSEDEAVVLGAVALLAVDAERTARALQSAAQPAGPRFALPLASTPGEGSGGAV